LIRKGQLYVVQLFYTHKKLGTETDRRMIHAPAGSAEQIASLPNNIEVANDVQAHEREVRARRNDPASFIEALDDILLFLTKNPDVYYAIPDSERTSLRKALEKLGMVYDHSSSYSKNDGSATFESDVYVLNIDD